MSTTSTVKMDYIREWKFWEKDTAHQQDSAHVTSFLRRQKVLVEQPRPTRSSLFQPIVHIWEEKEQILLRWQALVYQFLLGSLFQLKHVMNINKVEKKLPPGLWDEILEGLQFVQKEMGAYFGDPSKALLLSVRSGAAVRTNILNGIKSVVDPITEITYMENPNTEFIKFNNFSYAIVVVGEHPYTEVFGDSSNLTIADPGPSIITNVCGNVKCEVFCGHHIGSPGCD
ncbi:putative glucan 1,3-beta-glucosidase [Helianthus annuus]|uniref:Glucan 1,3-beta-glucosidase n=1 Tax=Helianthus annuus TaxID=4232 RepID=A0A9K3IV43_HELAN|nr:putative glucan 1,3-beta-glucosidase [Helianthus annuus]KAJ0560719.1 putative glucan 1,3-beta-glucosidase [Helianthus annuus]KAJ0573754.1 putative glucan 1,3-beta-glucosidase [Helianthus annuus]KAJ0912112.1 putative glucan 1,3-beta-glucosidase [Helianthus annuus]KAJ0915655.1 putative glucan 1,3-beta-glucosidase [Helianthus annuus]